MFCSKTPEWLMRTERSSWRIENSLKFCFKWIGKKVIFWQINCFEIYRAWTPVYPLNCILISRKKKVNPEINWVFLDTQILTLVHRTFKGKERGPTNKEMGSGENDACDKREHTKSNDAWRLLAPTSSYSKAFWDGLLTLLQFSPSTSLLILACQILSPEFIGCWLSSLECKLWVSILEF